MILTGDVGGGGVLKEFASPDTSSFQIQATPGRSCIVLRTLLDTRFLITGPFTLAAFTAGVYFD